MTVGCPAGQGQLLILSDMIEDSNTDIPALTCANVGTPKKNAHVLNLLGEQGRLPDLHYIAVQVPRSKRPQPPKRTLPNTLLALLLRAHGS